MNRKDVFCYRLLRPIVVLFLKLKFGYRFEKAKNLPDNYIVLSNHTTDYDPLLVAASFPRQMYFVASEHISRWKVFPLIDFLFAPIMRYKGTVAAATVIAALRKLKEGANVCIFAEGVRSWDGVTGPILPSTGKVVKKAGCGLVTYKITGGYFVSPNWSLSSNTRRGELKGAPVGVYTPEQVAAMTIDEINEIINRDLYEDAYARQLEDPKPYRGKDLAQELENLLFVCPDCKELDTFQSHGDTVTCKKCGLSITYDQYGMLHGTEQKTVRDLAAWQKRQVEKHMAAGVAYEAPGATLSKVKNQEETLLARGPVVMTSESIRCGEAEIFLKDIVDMAITGRHAIVFAAKKVYYELVPDKEYNAIRFLYYFESWRELSRQEGA